jgi:lipopolysaccharide export LptBFGC system permease protein LptF
MERLVDPAIGDVQTEYEQAVSMGWKWKSRRVWVLGHLALVRAMAVHASLRAAAILLDSRDDDHRPVRRTVLASSVIMAFGTVILMLPFLDEMRGHPDAVNMALYLVPQALPLSIPIGLTFGILWGLGRVVASYRSRTVILSLAVVASLVSFSMLAWVVPMANQAFRVSMAGHSLAKGTRELTLGELRTALVNMTPERAAAASSRHALALEYHKKWALGSAPVILAFFAVALTRRRQWGGIMPLLAGCFAILGYYAVMFSAKTLQLHHTSAFAAAWMANVTFLIVSLVIVKLTSRRTTGAPGLKLA